MYRAEIAAAAVLISFCAVLGRTSVIQLCVMGIIEVVVYCTNLYVGTNILKVSVLFAIKILFQTKNTTILFVFFNAV